MRLLLMLLLGLIVGAICGTIAARNIALAHAYPRGVMAVLQVHASAARRELARGGNCDAPKVRMHFDAIKTFSAEIGPALDVSEDPRAAVLFENMRASAADAARTAQNQACVQMPALLESVNDSCDECHREYR